MTKKLFYNDAYIKEFDATVLSCEQFGEKYALVLDQTAFFPEEGGQYSDRGEIGGVRVCKVTEEDGIIRHFTDKPFGIGEKVRAVIDFEERYEKMQCHTAEHILSGIIFSKFGLNNVGFHLGSEDVTMDISAPLSREQLREVELLANEAVYKNVIVSVVYPTPQEAAKLSYRSKKTITENVRIVNISDYDSCACCAPHVRATGEIGLIKILDFQSLRGGLRIHIAAGRRALRIFLEMQDNLSRISSLFSVPKLNCADAAEKFANDFSQLKNENKQLKIAHFTRLGVQVVGSDKSQVYRLENADYDEMRAFINSAKAKVGGMLVVVSAAEDTLKYVIFSEEMNMASEIKKINAALCGKGGGNAVMVQGKFGVNAEDCAAYFKSEYSAQINHCT